MIRRCQTSILLVAVMILTVSAAHASMISEKQELQMGRDAAREIEARYTVSTDKKANEMVREMGRQIAARSSRPNLPWEFKVLETGEVNAMAVPGYVYINRGLIDFAGRDRDALAGVVAHEIAHTAARHSVRAAEEQMKYNIGIQVLLKGRDARQLGSFAANLALLGYGRNAEFEADKLGLHYMTAAGYDPNGMVRFFRKLQEREGRNSGGLSVYFRTHPPTSERIARIEQEIKTLRVSKQPSSSARQTNGSKVRVEDLLWLVLAGIVR